MALLEIKGLKTHFKTDDGWLHAVDGVDMAADRGETLFGPGLGGRGGVLLGEVLGEQSLALHGRPHARDGIHCRSGRGVDFPGQPAEEGEADEHNDRGEHGRAVREGKIGGITHGLMGGRDRAGFRRGGLVMGERFDDARVTDRDELGGGQAPHVRPDADAADADDGSQHPEQVD